MLVQGLNSLHQISERVCISLWHMAYKELFDPIDASISLWCFVIWIRGEVKCKCVFLCILDMSSSSLSSPLNIAWANRTVDGWNCIGVLE